MGKHKEKEIKTNAMRILDNLDIEYDHVDYGLDHEFVSAADLAEENGDDLAIIYKTLACKSKEGDIYIFVIDSASEIDFKKAAKAVGVKSLSMLELKKLKNTVGYERGATTSLAMKKDFPVIVDIRAKDKGYIKVSAGKIGHGLKLRADDLIKATKGKYEDVVRCE